MMRKHRENDVCLCLSVNISEKTDKPCSVRKNTITLHADPAQALRADRMTAFDDHLNSGARYLPIISVWQHGATPSQENRMTNQSTQTGKL
jgi:hypothetical protein